MTAFKNAPETDAGGYLGDWKRGAPLGRYTGDHLGQLDGSSADDWTTFGLRRVRLDSGGYDRGGAYWGVSQRLFYVYAESKTVAGETFETYFRAPTRAAAKARIREHCPDAKFYA